jgi:hypothetical protein
MSKLDNISAILFAELGKAGKPVAIHNEGNFLVLKVGSSDTRIMNWHSMSPDAILEIAKSLVIQENFKGNVLLHG